MEPVLQFRRLLQSAPPQPIGQRCEFCDEPVGDTHSHVVDLERRGLLCVCRACYLLFTSPGAARGKYRAVPERYLHTPELVLSEAQWDEFQIPVGIAFFYHNSSQNRTIALYPSPAGATESALPVSAWEELATANPVLKSLQPDVEALLVSRLAGRMDAFVVPIDACYELVGRVRREWRGFGGGERAWSDIDGFFAALRDRAT
jgi:Family of unknown function (DUF5947)